MFHCMEANPQITDILQTPARRRFLLWLALSIALHLAILAALRSVSTLTIGEDRFGDFETLRMVEFKPPKGVITGVLDPKAPVERKGMGDGEGTSTGETTDDDAPLRYGVEWGSYGSVFDATIPPIPVTSTRPEYPPSMRKSAIEGVVVVEVGVDEQGRVLYGKIVSSPGKEFSVAVIQWIKELKFKPALDEKRQPFRCRINLPIRFQLKD